MQKDVSQPKSSKLPNKKHSMKTFYGNGTMKNFKAMKMVSYILGVYILSWMPSLVLLVVHSYYTATNHLCNDIKVDKVVWPWIEANAFTSSAINPLIFYVRNSEFRQAFRRTFQWLTFVHGQNSANVNLCLSEIKAFEMLCTCEVVNKKSISYSFQFFGDRRRSQVSRRSCHRFVKIDLK